MIRCYPDDKLKKIRHRAWERVGELGGVEDTIDIVGHISNVDVEKYISSKSAIVFIGGRYDHSHGLPDGVVVVPLNDAFKTYGAFLTNYLVKSIRAEKNKFVLANLALHRDGVFVYVPPGTEVATPIKILNILDAETVAMPQIQLFVGDGAAVNVHISTVGAGVAVNMVCGCTIGNNASLQYESSLSGINLSGSYCEAVRATLKKGGSFRTTTVAKQSASYDYQAMLCGEGGDADLSGVWVLGGDETITFDASVYHKAPHCCSRQLFRGVLDGRSCSRFIGTIMIDKDAHKSDAYQLNNNLLLSDDARAMSTPVLEIFADDVKASHGATVGSLNRDQLFYMTTRGIPLKEAERLLVDGFVNDIVGPMLLKKKVI